MRAADPGDRRPGRGVEHRRRGELAGAADPPTRVDASFFRWRVPTSFAGSDRSATVGAASSSLSRTKARSSAPHRRPNPRRRLWRSCSSCLRVWIAESYTPRWSASMHLMRSRR